MSVTADIPTDNEIDIYVSFEDPYLQDPNLNTIIYNEDRNMDYGKS